jgi:hypothetical protein
VPIRSSPCPPGDPSTTLHNSESIRVPSSATNESGRRLACNGFWHQSCSLMNCEWTSDELVTWK